MNVDRNDPLLSHVARNVDRQKAVEAVSLAIGAIPAGRLHRAAEGHFSAVSLVAEKIADAVLERLALDQGQEAS